MGLIEGAAAHQVETHASRHLYYSHVASRDKQFSNIFTTIIIGVLFEFIVFSYYTKNSYINHIDPS